MADHKFVLGCRFRVALLALIAVVITVVMAMPATAQDVIVLDDAVSRELTVLNEPELLTGPTDAVSRELTVLNEPELMAGPTDAISRELTVLNEPEMVTGPTDALSRELTVLNEPDSVGGPTDAISRELTVFNDPNAVQATDAISRELTVLNEPDLLTGPTDAVSRELTVDNKTLLELRSQSDGASVNACGLSVTGVFDDCIYVEDSFKQIGAKVTGGTAAIGDSVFVDGVWATDEHGNRCIAANEVRVIGRLEVAPYWITTRAARCGSALDPITAQGQRGATGGRGACMVGIEVRIAGKLYTGADGKPEIDDGSGPRLRVSLPDEASTFAEGANRMLTGVLALEKRGTEYVPILRVTDAGASVTASASANGSIEPSGTVSAKSGASPTFTIAPDAGYVISDVTVDGVSVGTVDTYTFSNIAGDHTISAAFAPAE